MNITFTVGEQTEDGTLTGAVQRCKGTVGWDDDLDLAITCGATRHAHMIGPWECGHDNAEGVILATMNNGASAEVVFPVDAAWSPMLLRLGL